MLQRLRGGRADGDADARGNGIDGDVAAAFVGADDAAGGAGCRVRHRRIGSGKETKDGGGDGEGFVCLEVQEAGNLAFARHAEWNAEFEGAEAGAFRGVAVATFAGAVVRFGRFCAVAWFGAVRDFSGPDEDVMDVDVNGAGGVAGVVFDPHVVRNGVADSEAERRVSSVARSGVRAPERAPEPLRVERIGVFGGIRSGFPIEVQRVSVAVVSFKPYPGGQEEDVVARRGWRFVLRAAGSAGTEGRSAEEGTGGGKPGRRREGEHAGPVDE